MNITFTENFNISHLFAFSFSI